MREAAIRMMLLAGRAGVLASIFLPHPAKPSSFLGPEAHPWDQRWPYVLLTVHVALALVALTPTQKDRAQLWPERAAVWLLLVATAFLAGQSDDRWILVLVVSEMAVVVFDCGGLTADADGVGQVLASARRARQSAQRCEHQLALSVARQAFEALAFRPHALDLTRLQQQRVSYSSCKAWQAHVLETARELLSDVAPVKELLLHATTLSSSGELLKMKSLGGGKGCSFEVDLDLHCDGSVILDSAQQRLTAKGVSVSVRASVQMPDAVRGRAGSGASVSLHNVAVALDAGWDKFVRTGETRDGEHGRQSIQTKITRLVQARLLASLGKSMTIALPPALPAAAASSTRGLRSVVESVSGCELCVLVRASLSASAAQGPPAWRLRAQVLTPGVGAAGDAWLRGRWLDVQTGPRRAALTLMVASEQDLVQIQVLQGLRSLAAGGAKVLGTWTGPARALLQAPKQDAIRVEGDVRLPLAGTRGLGLTVSARLVQLEAGAPSDLREVPGVGLRGLVGVVAGCIEHLVLSPWDCASCSTRPRASPSSAPERPLVIETSIGPDVSVSEPLPRANAESLPAAGMGDAPAAALSASGLAARVSGCEAETSFVLPLNHAVSGHVLVLRVLQGQAGVQDAPLRCIGQATLTVPGEASANGDALSGLTRLELMDGPAHVGFCLCSLSVKRSRAARTPSAAKTRFAHHPLGACATGPGRASNKNAAPRPSPSACKTPDEQANKTPPGAEMVRRKDSAARENLHEDTSGWIDAATPDKASAQHANAHVASRGILKDPAGSLPWRKAATSTGISIHCTRTYANPHDGYTVYVFKCSMGGSEWEIRRRFRDFDLLKQRLGKAAEHPDLQLPAKRFFGTSSETVVEERRHGLEAFLQALVKLHDPSVDENPGMVCGPDEGSPTAGSFGPGSEGLEPRAVVAAFVQMPGH